MVDVLSLEARNRTLLFRQGLIEPSSKTAPEWIDFLAGIQAQEKLGPYMGLAARIPNFAFGQLDKVRAEKQAVRCHMHRATVHLLATQDFSAWQHFYRAKTEATAVRKNVSLPDNWPKAFYEELGPEPFATKDFLKAYDKIMQVKDSDTYSEVPRSVFVGMGLVRTPGANGESLGGREKWTFFESYTERPFEPKSMESFIIKYLRAFGPATPADFSCWAGLPSQRHIFEAMGDLWTGESVDGHKLYDVEDSIRLSGKEEAPDVLVLADFDNVILGHQDRSLIMSKENRRKMNSDIRNMNPILFEGFLAGVWNLKTTGKKDLIKIRLFEQATASQLRKLEAIVYSRQLLLQNDKEVELVLIQG